jgi:hypothetical protein
MDFTVKKVEQIVEEPVSERAYYDFIYTKDAKTPDDKTVVVVDDNRKERLTLVDLENQKADLQKQLDEVNAKIEAINSLEEVTK